MLTLKNPAPIATLRYPIRYPLPYGFVLMVIDCNNNQNSSATKNCSWDELVFQINTEPIKNGSYQIKLYGMIDGVDLNPENGVLFATTSLRITRDTC